MLAIISVFLGTLLSLCESGGMPNPVIGAYFPNWAQYRMNNIIYIYIYIRIHILNIY